MNLHLNATERRSHEESGKREKEEEGSGEGVEGRRERETSAVWRP